jgi:hypothetical protein
LGRKGHFITLMTFEMDSGEREDVLRARYPVTLAEAIFTVWSGSFAKTWRTGVTFVVVVIGAEIYLTVDVHLIIPYEGHRNSKR